MSESPDTEYTPSVGEIRAGLIAGQVALSRTVSDPDILVIKAECGAQFDRWLDAHDREVAAKALEDAADHLEEAFGERAAGVTLSTPSSRRLRARAARIREGQADER